MNFCLDADGLFVREHLVTSAVAVKVKNQTAMKFYSTKISISPAIVVHNGDVKSVWKLLCSNCCIYVKLIYCNIKDINVKVTAPKCQPKKQPGIIKGFANIFASKEFSDVTLVTEDKTEFQVHKVVLCARSKVFAAMFRNDLREKLTGSITIDDMDSYVLKELLNYIYTDVIPKEMAADLFVAANKYALDDLQEMCEDFLIEAMSVDTVADILLLGDRHSSEHLKLMAVQFAIENIETVVATESWKRLRKIEVDLCMDVLEKAMQERL
ncbi:protein roadkill-like [Musca vetustissima]|uniref:protein roadkill-like n=1 Tax=Musca vetustissima TaxID=27455 RepID=UPI002AB7DAFA|nr:protein roadkill-like [Musca vetustissima]